MTGKATPVFYVGVVTNLAVDSKQVVLTLERAVAGTDTVTLVYGLRQQTTEPKPPCNVRDLAGNEGAVDRPAADGGPRAAARH